jgi:hypothetical protein
MLTTARKCTHTALSRIAWQWRRSRSTVTGRRGPPAAIRDELPPTIPWVGARPASQGDVLAPETALPPSAPAVPPGCGPPGPTAPRSRERSSGCAMTIIRPCGRDSLRSSRCLIDAHDNRHARAIAPFSPSSSPRRRSREREGPAPPSLYVYPARGRPDRAASSKDTRGNQRRNSSVTVGEAYSGLRCVQWRLAVNRRPPRLDRALNRE